MRLLRFEGIRGIGNIVGIGVCATECGVVAGSINSWRWIANPFIVLPIGGSVGVLCKNLSAERGS